MAEASPPWQALYDRIQVVRDGSLVYAQPATDAELDALAAEIGSPLPESYRAWMKRFGPGHFNNWIMLAGVAPRHGSSVISDTMLLRQFSHDHSDHYPNHLWLATLVSFGDSGGGDIFAWDPNAVTQDEPREYRFHFLRRTHEHYPLDAGASFRSLFSAVAAGRGEAGGGCRRHAGSG